MRAAWQVVTFVAWASATSAAALCAALYENTLEGWRDWRDERIAKAR